MELSIQIFKSVQIVQFVTFKTFVQSGGRYRLQTSNSLCLTLDKRIRTHIYKFYVVSYFEVNVRNAIYWFDVKLESLS